MPTFISSIKTFGVYLLIAAGAPAVAQNESWYAGQNTGVWGPGDSLGFRGSLPGIFGMPASGAGLEGLSVLKQYGGYRFSDSLAIEGRQRSVGLSGSTCAGDAIAGDQSRSCYSAAWSLSGIATLPFQSIGLSFHGRLGLHRWQKGARDEAINHLGLEDLGRVYGFGLSYEFNKWVVFHAESEHYSDLSGGNVTNPGAGIGLDASVHSIGLSIKF